MSPFYLRTIYIRPKKNVEDNLPTFLFIYYANVNNSINIIFNSIFWKVNNLAALRNCVHVYINKLSVTELTYLRIFFVCIDSINVELIAL